MCSEASLLLPISQPNSRNSVFFVIPAEIDTRLAHSISIAAPENYSRYEILLENDHPKDSFPSMASMPGEWKWPSAPTQPIRLFFSRMDCWTAFYTVPSAVVVLYIVEHPVLVWLILAKMVSLLLFFFCFFPRYASQGGHRNSSCAPTLRSVYFFFFFLETS